MGFEDFNFGEEEINRRKFVKASMGSGGCVISIGSYEFPSNVFLTAASSLAEDSKVVGTLLPLADKEWTYSLLMTFIKKLIDKMSTERGGARYRYDWRLASGGNSPKTEGRVPFLMGSHGSVILGGYHLGGEFWDFCYSAAKGKNVGWEKTPRFAYQALKKMDNSPYSPIQRAKRSENVGGLEQIANIPLLASAQGINTKGAGGPYAYR